MISLWASIIWSGVIFLVATAILILTTEKAKRSAKLIRNAILIGIGYALLAWCGLYYGTRIETQLDAFLNRTGLYYGYSVVAYGLIIAGALCWLKYTHLQFYALLEGLIGLTGLIVFSQAHAAIDLTAPDTLSVALLTGWVAGFAAPIYILIRGFSNLADAQAAKKARPAVAAPEAANRS